MYAFVISSKRETLFEEVLLKHCKHLRNTITHIFMQTLVTLAMEKNKNKSEIISIADFNSINFENTISQI